MVCLKGLVKIVSINASFLKVHIRNMYVYVHADIYIHIFAVPELQKVTFKLRALYTDM